MMIRLIIHLANRSDLCHADLKVIVVNLAFSPREGEPEGGGWGEEFRRAKHKR
jgi:hypothetical protein